MADKKILITAIKDGDTLELKLDADFADLSNVTVQLITILTKEMSVEDIVEYTAMMSAEVLMRKSATDAENVKKDEVKDNESM